MSGWKDYRGPTARWIGAAIFVAAAHAAVVWFVLNKTAAAARGEAAAAIMIELSPLPVAPDMPEQDLAPGPQMTESEPEPPPPEPNIVLPQQDPQKPPEEKKKPEPQKPKARQTSVSKPSVSRSQREAAAAEGISVNPYAAASWHAEVAAHLNRYKRFPPGASSSGTASVRFTISRSGQVLSAALSSSSGDQALDQEATSLLHRASPLPAPPREVSGTTITLRVPVHFSR